MTSADDRDDIEWPASTDDNGRYEWVCEACGHRALRLPPAKRPAKSVKCPKCKSPESLTIRGF